MSKNIGMHVNSDIDNLIKHIHLYKKMNCMIIQFFVDTNKHSIEKYIVISKLLVKYKIKCIVHGSYTINLANNWDATSSKIPINLYKFYHKKLI